MDLDSIILQIIKREPVSDQDALLGRLKKHGFAVNQSTLSRHLKKLGVSKHEGRYVIAQQKVLARRQAEIVLAPPNLILLKTIPAHAHALGYKLDALEIEQIAGTIAGDDTLMVAVKHPDFLKSVREKIEVFLETLN